MKFSQSELMAILHLAKSMLLADGKIDPGNEYFILYNEFMRFGLDPGHIESLLTKVDELEPAKAIEVVSRIDEERKKDVTAFLAGLLAADHKIHDQELALWKLISRVCQLPTMDLQEAISMCPILDSLKL